MKHAIKLEPRVYVDTLTDGRGGIFNWVPEHAIKEFNFLFWNKGADRGNHYHPHFHFQLQPLILLLRLLSIFPYIFFSGWLKGMFSF